MAMKEDIVRNRTWIQLMAVSAAATMLVAGVARADYEVVEVKDGGTIKGAAIWKGEVPKLPPIKVFKHMDTCGDSVPSPVLDVDQASKGLRFVLVYLEKIDKGKAPQDQYLMHMGKANDRPDSRLCNFEEHIFPFVRTNVFALQNFEKLLHNPHGFNDKAATLFNVALPDPLKVIEKKFPRAQGVGLKIQCDTHVHMNAWMAGFDHPYFAVTDAKGKFEITGVPPGKYTLVAWHEGYNIAEFASDHRPVYDEPHITKKEIEVKAGEPVEAKFEFPVRNVKVEWKIASADK